MGKKKSYYKQGGTLEQNKTKTPKLNRSVSVTLGNTLLHKKMKENLNFLRRNILEKDKLISDYRKQNRKLMLENKKISKLAEDLILELEDTQVKLEKYKKFFMNTRDGIYR